MSTYADEDADDEVASYRPLKGSRAEWERERRLTSAELFDRLADAIDGPSADVARWQAGVFRWSAERTR